MNATAPSAARWRLRDWPGDASIGHLVFVDHTRVPHPAEVARALDQARNQGKRAVRTSALFPSSASILDSMGFTTADQLALLRLDGLRQRQLAGGAPTRALRAWHRQRAAAVDQAAFGAEWGNDAAGLADITRATPVHRARWLGAEDLTAFAISGASGTTGYLQRIAVDPGARRRGLASALVIDALTWMQARRVDTVLVNTGVDNHAALALYARFGFVRMAEQLVVAEYSFEARS